MKRWSGREFKSLNDLNFPERKRHVLFDRCRSAHPLGMRRRSSTDVEQKESNEWQPTGIPLDEYDRNHRNSKSVPSGMFQTEVVGGYLIGGFLGLGSYGIVKNGIDSSSLRRCAVKMFVANRLRRIPNGPENAENELKLLCKLDHENVIKIHKLLKRGEDYFLMMEMCKSTLEDLCDGCPKHRVPLSVCHYYFCQLISGLEYLHGVGIIHKDIKPNNLLISYDNVLRISDFGTAQKLDMFSTDDSIGTFIGCPMIQPPELARGDKRFSGFKLDIWCCGVTLFKIITGEYPYVAMNEYLLIENVIKGNYLTPEWLANSSAALLLSDLLCYDAKKRPSIKEVKKHRWFLSSYPPKLVEKECEQCSVREKTCMADLLVELLDEWNDAEEVVQNVICRNGFL